MNKCVVCVFFVYVTLPFTYQFFYYVRIPYQMVTPEYSFSQTVDSLQDCVDLGAKNTSVILLKFNKQTNACTGYRYYTGYQYYYNTDVLVNFIRSHRCLKSVSIEEAEHLIIDNLFGENTCQQIYFENGSFSAGLSYSYHPGYRYCYQPYTLETVNTSYTGPHKNWQVGIIIAADNANRYESYIMARGQMTSMTKYTCEPTMRDRLYYDGHIYCYGQTAKMNVTNQIGNPCADLMTGGHPIRLTTNFLYSKIYGYPGQTYRPFSGIVSYDSGSTYVYCDNETVSTDTPLTWKSGYPSGRSIAVMNANLQLFDQNLITSVVQCMSDGIRRTPDSTMCTD